MTEIAPYTPPGSAEIDYTWNLASKLCKTEFVPNNLRGKPEAVLAVFLTGRELGIGPMQSLRDIYPVNGRPALMASLMVARVRGLGHRVRTIRSNEELATVQITRRGEDAPEPPVEFTIADAKRAGLTDKAVWRQYPKAMLWNRAAAAACRRDCPEALGGAVYTPEEIEDGHGTTTATWGAAELSEESGAGSNPPVSGDGALGSPAPGDQSGTEAAGARKPRLDGPVGDSARARERRASAPDPMSDPPSSPPRAGGGSDHMSGGEPVDHPRRAVDPPPDPTSGEGEREPYPGRGGAAGLPMGSVADRDDPSPDPTSETAEEGEAIPQPPDNSGEGSAVDIGGSPSTGMAVANSAGPSPVSIWCADHNQNIRIARVHLRKSHGSEFGDLKDWRDLDELRGERAALAIRRLDAWVANAKAHEEDG